MSSLCLPSTSLPRFKLLGWDRFLCFSCTEKWLQWVNVRCWWCPLIHLYVLLSVPRHSLTPFMHWSQRSKPPLLIVGVSVQLRLHREQTFRELGSSAAKTSDMWTYAIPCFSRVTLGGDWQHFKKEICSSGFVQKVLCAYKLTNSCGLS